MGYKKTVKMNTHKWVVENIVGNGKIAFKYDIEIKKTRQVSIATEILMLINRKEVRERSAEIKEIINLKRKGYKVKIRRRGNG